MGLTASPASDKKGEIETQEKLCELLLNMKCRISSPLLWRYELLRNVTTPHLDFRTSLRSNKEQEIYFHLENQANAIFKMVQAGVSLFSCEHASDMINAIAASLKDDESLDQNEAVYNFTRRLKNEEKQSAGKSHGFVLVKGSNSIAIRSA